MKAVWNNQIIAESDDTVVVEGNHYFPPQAVNKEFFLESELHTVCPWKGTASYYHIQVGDKVNEDAAWYYPSTSEAARKIENRIAFWRGVKVEE